MNPAPDRLWDLLAEKATQGLSEAQERELRVLLADQNADVAESLDLAAAAIDLAMAGPAHEQMPAHLQRRILAAAPSIANAPDTAPIARIGRRGPAVFAGWIAAAACFAIALVGWWARIVPQPPMQQQRQAMMAKPGVLKADWKEWSDPQVPAECKGVRGDVVWNEAEQRGFMRFSGLPANDPKKQQYQLWIVDERGMDQRISGAIFDATPGAEVIVPISPSIHTHNAAVFALTIEEPGGTWVSSMKRRVVIASLKQG